MPKTFELSETLLRRAEAAAADENCRLEDWVTRVIEGQVAAHEEAAQARAASDAALKAFESALQRMPDGSYFNPHGIEDERFFETLESLRHRRLT